MPLVPSASPTASFPTLPPAQVVDIVEESTNQTVPPPVSANYSALPYNLLPQVADPHYSYSLRPVTAFTITGPNAVPYFEGLLILPFVMIAGILVWLLILCIVDCQSDTYTCSGRKKAGKRRCGCCAAKQPSKNHDIALSSTCVFLLGAIIAWSCAIAYTSLATEVRDVMVASAQDISSKLYRGSALIGNASQALANVASAMTYLDDNCFSPGYTPPFMHTPEQLLQISYELQSGPQASTLALYHSMDSLAQYFSYVTNTLSISFLVVFCTQLFFTLLFAANLVMQHAFPAKQGKCLQVETCVARVIFVILGMLIILCCWACAAGGQALILMNSDFCTPNVQINSINVAAQLSHFEPLATYNVQAPNASVYDMCSVVTAATPIPVVSLCFYVTCNATQNFNAKVEVGISAFIAAVAKIVAVNQTLSAAPLDSELLQSCQSALETGVKESALAIVDLSWVAYSLSCPQVNPVVASVLYERACGEELTYTRGAVISVIIACCFTMVSVIIFVGSGLASTSEPAQFRCCPRRRNNKLAEEQSSSDGAPGNASFKAKQSSTNQSGKPGQAASDDVASKKVASKDSSSAVQLA